MESSLMLAAYLSLTGRGRKLSADEQHNWPTRPKGPLVWFHVPGEGSLLAVEQLITRLRHADDRVNVLITTPSSPLVGGNDCETLYVQAPKDHKHTVTAFLDHWKPDVVMWSRGYLRPRLIVEISARALPLHLIDATLAGIDAGWLPWVTKALVRRFRTCLAVNTDVQTRLNALGALTDTIKAVGALEEGTAVLNHSESEREDMAESLAARPVWLAAGIPKSEAMAVIDGHCIAIRRAHRLLLIAHPETPEVGQIITDYARTKGLSVQMRSEDDEPDAGTQVFVADIPDEMGLWYRIAPMTYMAGTLTGTGSRNPFEPAALGSAILYGPNITRYRGSYQRLTQAHGARLVEKVGTLGREVGALLSPDTSAQLAHAAWDVSSSGAEVTDRVIELITDAVSHKPKAA